MAAGIVWLVLILLLGGAAVFAWLIWRVVREQAQLRRTLDVVMLQVTLPKDVADDKEPIDQEKLREQIGVAEQWLATLSNLPTGGWDRLLYAGQCWFLR